MGDERHDNFLMFDWIDFPDNQTKILASPSKGRSGKTVIWYIMSTWQTLPSLVILIDKVATYLVLIFFVLKKRPLLGDLFIFLLKTDPYLATTGPYLASKVFFKKKTDPYLATTNPYLRNRPLLEGPLLGDPSVLFFYKMRPLTWPPCTMQPPVLHRKL